MKIISNNNNNGYKNDYHDGGFHGYSAKLHVAVEFEVV